MQSVGGVMACSGVKWAKGFRPKACGTVGKWGKVPSQPHSSPLPPAPPTRAPLARRSGGRRGRRDGDVMSASALQIGYGALLDLRM